MTRTPSEPRSSSSECERVSLLLHEWLRDELGPAVHAEIRDHLVDCARCTRERLVLEQLESHFAADPGPMLEEVAAARLALRRRLANEQQTRRARPVSSRIRGALARAAAFVVSIGLLVPIGSSLRSMAGHEPVSSADVLKDLWEEMPTGDSLGIEDLVPELSLDGWVDVIQGESSVTLEDPRPAPSSSSSSSPWSVTRPADQLFATGSGAPTGLQT